MESIPFFYYDIVARIIPGGLVVAILALTQPEVSTFFSGGESWKTAAVPLALAGASYMVGVLLEVLFSDWGFWEGVGDESFQLAIGNYSWSSTMPKPKLDDLEQSRRYRNKAWSYLVLAGKEDQAQAFAHAHRFWAEAKMCLHCVWPLFVASIILLQSQWWLLGISVFFAALAATKGVHSRDRRRWVQTLESIKHLGFGRELFNTWEAEEWEREREKTKGLSKSSDSEPFRSEELAPQ